MQLSQPIVSPTLVVICLVMVLAAGAVYWSTALGSPWTVPRAAVRAVLQLAAVAAILTTALTNLRTSLAVLVVMFVAATITAARRSQSNRSWLLGAALATGMISVVPLLLASGLVPMTGVAIVPIVGILLGSTMTAVAVAARRALDTLGTRAGEVEALLSLGFSDRLARMEMIGPTAADALLPNLDQTRTVGLVTLPGAFVGVLLSTGSAMQAGAVQILILLSILLSQTCAVAVTLELIARGNIVRDHGAPVPARRGFSLRRRSSTGDTRS
ncbi:ABC transporter permease [Mycobacterium sp. ENV421]|uniref:ABC transporter permease n=1 Tax=Mycobacterium sp. ENV421 TaxID=1213407 RepID=UPI000C9B0954|nr:ABC transporter permease [Mycobacterium sp. ENV421]PND57259.1 ABC transporter permease [Mycobacterium sp. ENV421]